MSGPLEQHNSSEVLMVESDPTVCMHIGLLLKHMGLGCLMIASAAQALAAVQSTYFPLIIIDHLLGDGDGIELCSRIRGAAKGCGSYIVLLSTVTTDAELARALAAGADDYVSKTAPDIQILECLRAASRYVRLPRSI